MMSRSMLTALLPHDIYMVYSWMMHRLWSRMHSRSIVVAQTIYNSINRVVVMTTYPMINDSIINKSQVRISCEKFTRELNKEPLLN